jgi:hypothetical protein
MINELKRWLLEEPTTITSAQADQWASDFAVLAGADWNWKPREADFQIPAMCAVPLESQILRYGPWYISNTAGKVEFENDSSLVPWNFGNYTAMNNAGWAKVTSALTSQQSHEQGQVEYPGVPTLSLGSALINSGPFITDVNVQVGEQGVTTTYRMNTWNYQFGRLGKYNVERFARLSKVAQEQRKAFRQFYGYAQPLSLAALQNEREVPKDQPSVVVFAGEMVIENSGDPNLKAVRPSVAAQTHKTMLKSVGDDSKYANKAGVAADGLFIPYTTKTDSASTLPKFEEPNADASTPNVNNLNPFGGDSVSLVFKETDSGLPDKLTGDNATEVKSIALRAPVIIGGWGYTTGGLPVPSGETAETVNEFFPNHKKRADKWKVGPLDVRWDDSKKTWNAVGGGEGVWVGTVYNNNIAYAGHGNVLIKKFSVAAGSETTKPFVTDEIVDAYEYVLPVGDVLYDGTDVVVTKSEGTYIIVGTINTCGA